MYFSRSRFSLVGTYRFRPDTRRATRPIRKHSIIILLSLRYYGRAHKRVRSGNTQQVGGTYPKNQLANRTDFVGNERFECRSERQRFLAG